MHLCVHRSNRVERLAQALGDILATPPADPFVAETVVVHSRSMAMWLSMVLSQKLGIVAHTEFPFPGPFIGRLLRSVLGCQIDTSFYDDPCALTWRIFALLSEPPVDAGRKIAADPLQEILRYSRRDPSGRERFELAQNVAHLFHRCVISRPELVAQWDRGEDSRWQAELWRQLRTKQHGQHLAQLREASLAALHGPRLDLVDLPERICLFGLGSLPPSYLELLAGLARHRDVHLFVPSPSHNWWADMQPQRRPRRNRAEIHDPLQHFFVGHPLLTSLGGVAREFQGLLEELTEYTEPSGDLYHDPLEDPPEASALHRVQSDLLHLRWPDHRDTTSTPEAKPLLRPDDNSIVVLACHTQTREVEALRDWLLELLRGDATLEPRDIVVLLPQVDEYAPLIEAVFSRDHDDPTALPYSIADQGIRLENPTIEALWRTLDLVEARLTATEVLDLLTQRPIARKFELSDDDIDRIGRWVLDVGICWGIDGEHRASFGQPAVSETTWTFGLRRLLLGYATGPTLDQLVAGLLPFGEIEGQQAALLGKLSQFCERLFHWIRHLRNPRSAEQWRQDLNGLTDAMFAADDRTEWQLDAIRDAISTTAAVADVATTDLAIPLCAFRAGLLRQLEGSRAPKGFMVGGVTFCGLVPMRAIAARVIAVMGLSDGAFPRSDPTSEYDLIRAQPQPGDRNLRDDDRYAFLEAILSARQHLLFTYVGQSIQDDSDLPPSVVLADLLDVLCHTFELPGTAPQSLEARRRALHQRFVIRTAMQPFSPRNYGADANGRGFSYDRNWLAGARALSTPNPRVSTPRLFSCPLPPPTGATALDIEHLIRFFRDPQRQLVRDRLGAQLSPWVQEQAEREPIALTDIQRFRLGQEFLTLRLRGLDDEHARRLLTATGHMPLGALGTATLDVLHESIAPILARVAKHGPLPPLEAEYVCLDLSHARVAGWLPQRQPGGFVLPRYARADGRQFLEVWLYHLALSCAHPDRPGHSVLVSRGTSDNTVEELWLRPPDNPAKLLDDLVAVYQLGQQEPLLLFPAASATYCGKLLAGASTQEALHAAARVFERRPADTGHRPSDPYFDRIFADSDVTVPGFSLFATPMAAGDFGTLAQRVFSPLFMHRVDQP